MQPTTDVAIIGAGPYGLSLAAHLLAAGLDVRLLGQPMRFWRQNMPEGMVLKSEGFASTLWDPEHQLTLEAYCRAAGEPYQHSGLPVPLQTFQDYGLAFQQRFVPELDVREVVHLHRSANKFHLRLSDGDELTARRVVLATGIGAFRHIPDELAPIAGTVCSHSTDHRNLERFAGKSVLVVGGGASGIEMAGLMSQIGTDVTVVTRHQRIAYCNPPAPRGWLERLQAPESGLGTGWRSLACVMAPMLFHRMPASFRHMVVQRHLGPAPSWTSREAVERNVRVLLGTQLSASAETGGKAAVMVWSPDGAVKTLQADHVIAATGFRVDMRRLHFLSPALLSSLRLFRDTPVLSPWFETSVPGLHAVGGMAANSFGPLVRFVYGAGFTSRRLTRHLLHPSKARQAVDLALNPALAR